MVKEQTNQTRCLASMSSSRQQCWAVRQRYGKTKDEALNLDYSTESEPEGNKG